MINEVCVTVAQKTMCGCR